ncbi:helix-turn-helix domain-containing protein [Paenibacillus sp. D51F]
MLALINGCFGIAVRFIDPQHPNREEREYAAGEAVPLIPVPGDMRNLSAEPRDGAAAILHQTDEGLNYIEIRVHGDEAYEGSFLAGPVLYAAEQGSRADVIKAGGDGLDDDSHAGGPDKKSMRLHSRSLPVLGKNRFLEAGVLMHYLVYGTLIAASDIRKVDHAAAWDSGMERKADLDVSMRLYELAGHHDLSFEKKLIRLVKEGRVEELAAEFSGLETMQGIGILSRKSRVRHEKNLGIVGIALAARAAIEGGLHPEVAYTMSDLHIQHIEELVGMRDIRKAMGGAMTDFARKVRDSRDCSVSIPIARCRNYIFMHLYEPISLTDLCRLVNLNASYLSRRFKKETGFTVMDCIQSMRVEEAKKLLGLTELSITEISTRLTFSDQSYFTKVFRKWTGITPGKYRNGTEAAGAAGQNHAKKDEYLQGFEENAFYTRRESEFGRERR